MFARDARGTATIGGLPVDEVLTAARCKTPAYLYDLDAMRQAVRSLAKGLAPSRHLIAYATKANSAGPVLRALFAEGCGADVVSGGELELALAVGLEPDKIVFSGVAKRDDEIDRALTAGPLGIAAIQTESVEELVRVAARARALGRRARVSIRINPSVEIDTHAHVATGHDAAKFGVSRGDLGEAYGVIDQHAELALVGLSCHIGSTQRSLGPYLGAARILFEIAQARQAAEGGLEFVDAGGGYGIDYGQGCPVTPADFARAIVGALEEAGLSSLRLFVEPGRSLVAPFGVLVSTVIQTKVSRATGHRWMMIDAGMNDLIRPALYQANHRIEPVRKLAAAGTVPFRVVGPICESSDDFGVHHLPHHPAPLHVIIRDTGAYGFVMASQYNGRPLPAEVFVAEGRVQSVIARSELSDWIAGRLETQEIPG